MSAEEYLRVLEQPLQLRHIKRTVPTYRISQCTAKAGKKKRQESKEYRRSKQSREELEARTEEGKKAVHKSFRERGTKREVLRYRGDYSCLRNISPKDNIYNPIRSCPRNHSKKV